MKYKEWTKEIDKLTKDELTMFLSAYNRIVEWKAFSDAFQLRYFKAMVPYVEQRIEQLATFQGGFSR